MCACMRVYERVCAFVHSHIVFIIFLHLPLASGYYWHGNVMCFVKRKPCMMDDHKTDDDKRQSLAVMCLPCGDRGRE